MRIHAGFSLIELLVVISIIAVLAAMLLPAVNTVRMASKRAACLANVRQLGMAVVAYYGENEGLLPNVQIKVNAIPAWGSNPNTTYTWCDNKLAGAYLDLSSWSGGVTSSEGHNVLACPSDARGKQGTVYFASYGMNFNYAPDINNPADWATNTKSVSRFTKLGDRLLIIECNESRFHPGWGTPVPMTQSVTPPVNHDFYGDPGSWHNWRSYHDGRGANAGFMDGHCTWVAAPQTQARSGDILVQ